MKKLLITIVAISIILGACAPAKSEGMPVTVYLSPT